MNHRFRHGGVGTPAYRSYTCMKQRCLNPNNADYDIYGGRGITVCDRWLGADGFKNFLADMGQRPDGTTLDRIDTSGNYEPSNCRWATFTEQNNNKSGTRPLTFLGRTQTTAQWAREYGLPPTLVSNRLGMGWSVEDAIASPLGKRRA